MSVQAKTHTRKFYYDLVLEYLKNNPGKKYQATDIHEALKDYAVNNDIRIAILDLIISQKVKLLPDLRIVINEF